ncbi:MAG TPA: PorV/PorQ family protein [Rubricoccaceae bacterium]|nr:PorV/PorQ family protein [Rubricoccaceae bacterium]
MKTSILALAALVGVALAAPGARAQGDDRAGTAAMEELLVPVTARTVALGTSLTSGLANLSGVEAVQSNPAALMTNNGTSALFSRTEYWADIGVNYFGVAQRFGANNVAISLTSWDYGEILRTDEQNPENDPNVTWEASTLVIGATFARQFTDRISAGATLKALNRSLDDANSNGLAFDAGMTYVVGESGLRFGVSLQNFGPEMDFSGSGLAVPIPGEGPEGEGEQAGEIDDLPAELPSLLSFGAAYTRPMAGSLSLTGMASYRSNAYDLDQYTAGVEVGYANLFYVRGGVNVTSDTEQHAWEIWNVGAGLNFNLAGTNLLVDYAFRPSSVFDGVHMFTVGVGL